MNLSVETDFLSQVLCVEINQKSYRWRTKDNPKKGEYREKEKVYMNLRRILNNWEARLE